MSTNDADILCKSVLKQQCIDENGLYSWKSKNFSLSSNGFLEIESKSQIQSISLATATYAKEWLVSSVMAGYGFDVVWATGSIWSFLANDEKTCNSWVKSINHIIQRQKHRTSSFEETIHVRGEGSVSSIGTDMGLMQAITSSHRPPFIHESPTISASSEKDSSPPSDKMLRDSFHQGEDLMYTTVLVDRFVEYFSIGHNNQGCL